MNGLLFVSCSLTSCLCFLLATDILLLSTLITCNLPKQQHALAILFLTILDYLSHYLLPVPLLRFRYPHPTSTRQNINISSRYNRVPSLPFHCLRPRLLNSKINITASPNFRITTLIFASSKASDFDQASAASALTRSCKMSAERRTHVSVRGKPWQNAQREQPCCRFCRDRARLALCEGRPLACPRLCDTHA